MIDIKARINEPEDVEATLTISMTLKEWIELAEQLSDAHPSWKLTSAINDVVYKVKGVFVPED